MSSRTLELFEKPPRRKRRVMMHVYDAGHANVAIVKFKCTRCPYVTDWMKARTLTEDRAGMPCPRCNP